MNEPSKVELDASLPEQGAASATVERAPEELAWRLDPPHSQAAVPVHQEVAAPQAVAQRSAAGSFPDTGQDVRLIAPLSRKPADPERDDHWRESQSGQIAVHLRQQYAELDRREQRLHLQLAQIDQERREQRLWVAELESGLEEREVALARQEAELTQRTTACTQLETELRELQESLLRERHSLTAEREQFIQDRDEQTQAIEALRARQQVELERLRGELTAEHAAAEAELKQRSVMLENRYRFQHEHLQRTMREFEATQNQFRREQQLARARDEEIREQAVLRSRQLERRRQLLDERQQSIERERLVLMKERRALEDRLAVDAENLRREQVAWETDRDTQKADLRRQQDLLALHAENLENRRQRLDRLRAELEETNRQTLELRLAVEESAAQLMQSAGSDVAQQRIDEAHAVLAEYYRHTRESLLRQHQEIEQAQVRVQEQRQEFRDERQVLVGWITQQEEQLALREQSLRAERAALEQHYAQQQLEIARLTAEKLDGESQIRGLLQQLSACHAD